ncbi:MAG: hypothetical protein Ta2D_09470 [Rickettsiales bacterium]|nr:MAG: hypothetical protein Ta2D_09470 [Rickettsiales bacterium]
MSQNFRIIFFNYLILIALFFMFNIVFGLNLIKEITIIEEEKEKNDNNLEEEEDY